MNQYDEDVYLKKYADTQNGIAIDQYTETRDMHYKIWCIENGEFSKETWYKLMIISLPPKYQNLLNEMLSYRIRLAQMLPVKHLGLLR